jgi:hypothetical protein
MKRSIQVEQLDESAFQPKPWRSVLLDALPIIALVLGAFYYWFAVADRYIVFLYNHDMGPLYPDTSPFSRVTVSRYWMAGLVVSGVVMVLHTVTCWLLTRLFARYRPPSWWRLWALCAPPLLIGIPAITMSVNEPTLPLKNATQATLVTLIGVGLALSPGELAARRPGELPWLAADGFGLALLLNLVHIENLGRWLARGESLYLLMMAVSLLAGGAWLIGVTGLRWWRRREAPGARAILFAGACIAYLLLPLVHHILGTDGHYYISDSDNFFAQNPLVQVVVWLAAGGVALGLARLRRQLATRQPPFQQPKD